MKINFMNKNDYSPDYLKLKISYYENTNKYPGKVKSIKKMFMIYGKKSKD